MEVPATIFKRSVLISVLYSAVMLLPLILFLITFSTQKERLGKEQAMIFFFFFTLGLLVVLFGLFIRVFVRRACIKVKEENIEFIPVFGRKRQYSIKVCQVFVPKRVWIEPLCWVCGNRNHYTYLLAIRNADRKKLVELARSIDKTKQRLTD